ncbi:sensor histidine kinase [Streptomyces sp. NPDC049879]|uniref:sensor histidine kinase n=1 Tax=Streptomyces sp. NPDC049879 TaxID=3365598 RepID=UPI00379DC7FB
MDGRNGGHAAAPPRLQRMRVRFALLGAGLFLAVGAALIAVTHTLLRRPPPEPPAPESEPGTRARLTLLDGESSTVTTLPTEAPSASAHPVLLPGALILCLAVAAAALLGWLLAGQVLRPLRRATESARRAGRRDATPLPATGGTDDLSAAVDTLADRLIRSADTPHRFAAHAVRELAAPVAQHRARIETVLRAAPPSTGIRELGERLLDVTARQERVLAGLLLLAEPASPHAPADLATLADRAVAHAEREAAASRVTVHLSNAPAPTRGDPPHLEALVTHLVANAVRHNTRDGHGWVHVRTGTAPGGWAEIEVSNSGPPIPLHTVPELFEPFRRLTPDRVGSSSGPGLGLSIIATAVHHHRGTLTAHPHPEGGLTITAALPAHLREEAVSDMPTTRSP